MIDRSHGLPVKRQAQILRLSRSSVSYRPVPTSESDLTLMRRMDELHLEHPFAGSRMLRDMLRRDGQGGRTQAHHPADAQDGHRSPVPVTRARSRVKRSI